MLARPPRFHTSGPGRLPGLLQRPGAILGLVIVLLAAGAGPATAREGASAWASNDHAAVRLVSAAGGLGAEGAVRLGLEFRLRPGWKIYWRSPGDAGIPPRVDWRGSDNLAAAEMRWPLPERYTIFGLTTLVYGDTVILPIEARAADRGRALALRAAVSYLVCEKICVPYDAALRLDLPPGAGTATAHAERIAAFAERVPRRIEGDLAEAPMAVVGATLVRGREGLALEVLARARDRFEAPDVLVEGPAGLRFGRPEVELAADRRSALFRLPATVAGQDGIPPRNPGLTVTLADHGAAVEQTVTAETRAAGGAAAGLLTILGIALLGGFILNFMPCVLPVLSLKIVSAVGQGASEARTVRRGFLATSAGILCSFLVLAGLALALKGAGAAVGWGIQFQEPAFLAAMTVVVVLFAANLFGFFAIPMPGFVGTLAAGDGTRGGGLAGAFATGAFATLLATPCSAPFLGTAIGFALSRGAWEIVAVFTALGLGLALPYLLVAAFPALALRLPRPGPWMRWLRVVLGLALLGTAAWLVSVLWAVAGAGAAGTVAVALGTVFAVLAGRRRLPVRARAAAGIAVALLAAAAVAAGPLLAREGGGRERSAAAERIPWRPFDKVALLNLVAEGRAVFVDVTADWCITCQANKALVIDRGEVARRLASGAVVPMRADWTRPDPAISAYLRSFGRFGIPFNAVYGPAAPQGIALSELLTEGEVLAAFAAARGADGETGPRASP